MSKLNYLGFSLLLLFVGFSFYIFVAEPHNFLDYNVSIGKVPIQNNDIEFSSPQRVERWVVGSHDSLSTDANTNRALGRITNDQYIQINGILHESLSYYNGFSADTQKWTNAEANKSLYSALWLVTKAENFNLYFSVINCVNSSLEVVSRYKPVFYHLEKKNLDEALRLKEEANYFTNHLGYFNYRPEQVNKVVNDVQWYVQRENHFKGIERECYDFKKLIDDDFNYQRFLFKIKALFFIFVVVLAFYFGKILTLERIKTIRDGFKGGITNIIGSINALQNPGRIKKETVEHIIKLSSLTTTIVTIGGLIVTTLGIKGWFFSGTIIVCILSLLLSVVLGIASINSNSAKQREGCYFLFLLGLVIFILIIFEIVFIFSVASITISLKQTLLALLSNSTIT